MGQLESLMQDIEETEGLIQDTARLIAEYPETPSLEVELRSLKKRKEKLENEAVTVTGKLVGADALRRDARLMLEDGTLVQGKMAKTVDETQSLSLHHRYQVRLSVKRTALRSGKSRTVLTLSDFTPLTQP
jgi:hypothetical protein